MSDPRPSLTDDLVWCESVWCGLEFSPAEGWGGLCPSCLALVDEHLGYGHAQEVDACGECRRAGPAPRPAQRLGGRGMK